MATQAQITAFIKAIAPCAQKAFKTLGKVKPSICIAMACVESAYGTAGSCKHNSFLGQKVGTGKTATKYWGGKFFSSKTKEEYTIGVHSTITAAFRAYDSMEQCVFNYYELLNTKLYARVQANADYKTQMQQIKACGYMTSSTEVNSVLNLIAKYNLTQYDGVENAIQPVEEYREPVTNLKRGSKGNGVKWVQDKLNKHGYSLTIDGIFGEKTESAVKNFQTAKNITVDGIVGRQTREYLKK